MAARLDSTAECAGDGSSFALTGRAAPVDPALPVRGDLAHIRLAGQVFVPYYAVPMPHVARAEGADLCRTAKGEPVARLGAGARFDVLDIAGQWCWGEAAGGGVFYVAQSELSALP